MVDRQFVSNLPLNGRSFQSLITLTPGVVLTKTIVQDQGQFSVNGQRANSNYFTVDGVSANIGASASTVPGQSGAGALPGLSASGGTNNLVSVDALQEFKVQTSTFAPEFGRSPGAQVSIITRSGTNDFRGSVFNYFRNDMFDANDWFGNRLGRKNPLCGKTISVGFSAGRYTCRASAKADRHLTRARTGPSSFSLMRVCVCSNRRLAFQMCPPWLLARQLQPPFDRSWIYTRSQMDQMA